MIISIDNYYQIHYPKKAVAIVIFDEEDNILLIQNRRYTVGRLEWEVPAGRIEYGERIYSCKNCRHRNCV